MCAAAALRAGDARLGTLTVTRARCVPFSAEDIELLNLFAQHAAQAIEHARLRGSARCTTAQLAAPEARFRTLVEEAPEAIFVPGSGCRRLRAAR